VKSEIFNHDFEMRMMRSFIMFHFILFYFIFVSLTNLSFFILFFNGAVEWGDFADFLIPRIFLDFFPRNFHQRNLARIFPHQ
jgi:hypothetical protein